MKKIVRFEECLKRERELHHLSKQDLARGIDADVKTVRRWERGDGNPSPYFRRKLAEFFGKSFDAIGQQDDDKDTLISYHVPANSSDSAPVHQPATINTENNAPSLPASSVFVVSEVNVQGTSLFVEKGLADTQKELSEVPYITNFQGRVEELGDLTRLIENKHCQLIALLGMGGVGKTALAARILEYTQQGFVKLIWRSLHNAPPFEHIIKQCIQFVSDQRQTDLPENVEAQISLLIGYLQRSRCLIVLDNVESIMQAGFNSGQYRQGYESYGRLFQRLGEVRHQSCLLLTSREKPKEVATLEGKNTAVYSLYLKGLGQDEGKAILREKDLFGQDEQWSDLVNLYAGNPLALKLASGPIEEIFAGDIARFLQESEAVFGDITDLLDQQFQRLTAQEQEIMYWLAIEREAVTLEDLHQDIVHVVSRRELVGALASLRRRSMVEVRGSATFSLQAAIMEYTTSALVKHFVHSFNREGQSVWHNYALLKAQARDYVRESQLLLLMLPVAQFLRDAMKDEVIEADLLQQLAQRRQNDVLRQCYLGGNVLNLLLYLQRDLRGKDFSDLAIRQANLQNVAIPGINFSHARFIDTLFTNTFGKVQCVAFNPRGDLLAVGTASGDIWMYNALSKMPLLTCHQHTDGVWSLAFNDDGTLFASCSDDETIRIWESSSGRCLKTFLGHTNRVRSVAFNHTGDLLGSCSEDQTVRLWDVQTGACLSIFKDHTDRVWSLACSPDGMILASGSTDQTVCLWDMQSRRLLLRLHGHTDWVRCIVFSPDGNRIASCSDDRTIMVWDCHTGSHLQTLRGHAGRVWTLAFHSSGQKLVSGSEDRSVRIWDLTDGHCSATFSGHTNGIRSVAFSPDGQTIVSGGDDQTMRFWDVASGHSLKTLHGYANRVWSAIFATSADVLVSCHEDSTIRLWDMHTNRCYRIFHQRHCGVRAIALHPDGHTIASGGEDQLIRLWNAEARDDSQTLQGHIAWIRAVAFSADGRLLASGGEDAVVRLWSASTGLPVATLSGHTSWIRTLAFHPTCSILASGGDDGTIRLWDILSGRCINELRGHKGQIRSISFHPDGQLLASASEDRTLRFWDISTGACLTTLSHHQHWVRSVAFSPDGQYLASASDDHTICVWSVETAQPLRTFVGHTERVRWVAFRPDGETLVSSSDDESIKIWQVQTGHCLHTLLSERPYENMNITAAQGLTNAQKQALKALGAIEEGNPEDVLLL